MALVDIRSMLALFVVVMVIGSVVSDHGNDHPGFDIGEGHEAHGNGQGFGHVKHSGGEIDDHPGHTIGQGHFVHGQGKGLGHGNHDHGVRRLK